jgi:hypothetical protein
VIVAALSGASLCDACVAAKAGIAETDVRAALARVAATVMITTEFGRCERCMRADLLSRLG